MKGLKMSKCGELTEAIKIRSVELLGYEIEKRELDFMPYLSHLIANNICLDKISDEEKSVLEELKTKGLVIQNRRLQCTFNYWVAMQEICYIAYIDHSNR